MAIAPVAFLLIYIYKKDVIEKEPTKALVKAFFGGCLVAAIVLAVYTGVLAIIAVGFPDFVAHYVTMDAPITKSLVSAFVGAAIPEELFKFLILYWLVWKSKDFDENFDGIVYAVYVSMGFACVENITYAFDFRSIINIIFRAFTAVPGHFFFAVIMGYYFSRAKFFPETRSSCMKKAIILPILAHGGYDSIIFLTENLGQKGPTAAAFVGILVIFFFVFNFKLWKQGRKRIAELREEDKKIKEQNQNPTNA